MTTFAPSNQLKYRPHDLLACGFPCQPFSRAGIAKRHSLGQSDGFADLEKGNIFFKIAHLIDETEPKAFLLENVPKPAQPRQEANVPHNLQYPHRRTGLPSTISFDKRQQLGSPKPRAALHRRLPRTELVQYQELVRTILHHKTDPSADTPSRRRLRNAGTTIYPGRPRPGQLQVHHDPQGLHFQAATRRSPRQPRQRLQILNRRPSRLQPDP